MNDYKPLEGRIALVTGVSRLIGIGAAVCRALAEKGADVFFTYWTAYDNLMPWGVKESEPERLLKELKDMGIRCECFETDLSKSGAHVSLLDKVEGLMGLPDMLINNACYSVNDDLWNIDGHKLDAHYEINIRATTMLSVEFARRFNKKSGGRIINLTSGQSKGPMVDELSYAITKGAIETITYTLAAAVAERGITVNAINPGPTDTGWMTEELERELLPKFPYGRIGKPEDAARLITFLAGDEAQWITGQIIHSEGGFKR